MVTWRTIRGAGHFGQSMATPKILGPHPGRFLRDVATAFARSNSEYFSELGEFPFSYTERTVKYFLGDAMRSSGYLPFLEQPIGRNRHGTEPSGGWLDAWVLDPLSDSVYLIEYKHKLRNTNNHGNAPERGEWAVANQQLRDLHPDDVSELTEGRKHAFKIALMTVWMGQNSDTNAGIEFISKEELANLETEISAGWSPTANWAGIWSVARTKQAPQEWNDARGHWFSNPGVYFFARVDRLGR